MSWIGKQNSPKFIFKLITNRIKNLNELDHIYNIELNRIIPPIKSIFEKRNSEHIYL